MTIRIIDADGKAIDHPTPAVSLPALQAQLWQLRTAYARQWGRGTYGYIVRTGTPVPGTKGESQ